MVRSSLTEPGGGSGGSVQLVVIFLLLHCESPEARSGSAGTSREKKARRADSRKGQAEVY